MGVCCDVLLCSRERAEKCVCVTEKYDMVYGTIVRWMKDLDWLPVLMCQRFKKWFRSDTRKEKSRGIYIPNTYVSEKIMMPN